MLSPGTPNKKVGAIIPGAPRLRQPCRENVPVSMRTERRYPMVPRSVTSLGTASEIAQATGASSNVLAVLFAPCAMAGLQKRMPIS